MAINYNLILRTLKIFFGVAFNETTHFVISIIYVIFICLCEYFIYAEKERAVKWHVRLNKMNHTERNSIVKFPLQT